MTHCKCDFPTEAQWLRTDDGLRDESYSEQHRRHHRRWEETGPAPDVGRDSHVEVELRLCRLEAALESQGFVLPELRNGMRETVSGSIRARYRALMKEGS